MCPTPSSSSSRAPGARGRRAAGDRGVATPHPLPAAAVLGRTGSLELTTVGRRTGLPRTVELSFAAQGERIYLLAHPRSQWVRNLRARPAATAQVGPLRLPVEAEFPGDRAAALATAWRLFTAKYGEAYMRTWYAGTDRIPVVLRIAGGEALPGRPGSPGQA